MDALNWKSLLFGATLCMSGAAVAQTPNTSAPVTPPAAAAKSAPYDCFGLDGVALRHCMDLNAAAASAGNNAPGLSHDCGGMTGAALATCRELNGEASAAPVNSYNPGAYGYYSSTAPSYALPGNIPPAGNATGPGSSSGSNPTGLSAGSGTTGLSSGSNATGLSGGSGKSPASGVSVPGISSNASSSAGGRSGR